jgi:hypothetical protein
VQFTQEQKENELPKKTKKRKKLISILLICTVILFAPQIWKIVTYDFTDVLKGKKETGIGTIYKGDVADVQMGYLGNYNTVTIKEVLEFNWSGGRWYNDINDDGEVFIDYRTDDKNIIQFTMDKDMKTFRVSALVAEDLKGDQASDVKWYLDAMYEKYAKSTQNKDITIDTSLDNYTLQGSVNR